MNTKALIVSLLLGLMMPSLAPAAASWDASALKTVSPEDRFFPKGYEVVSAPSLTGEVIKEMPAGDARVAAYLEVGGQRYYMTDWSYDRYRQGLSYNWIRAKGSSASGSSTASMGSAGGYRITGVPAGETLSVREGPGTNFPVKAELPNGKEGIDLTGDAVMNGSAEWVPISVSGSKGWVRSKYLARSSGGSSSGASSGSSTSTTSTPAVRESGGLYLTVKNAGGDAVKLWFPRAKNEDEISWSGNADSEGYATGSGLLHILREDKTEFYTGVHTAKRGRMDGLCVIYYPLSRAYYIGYVVNLDEEGMGRMIYPNGAVYDGQWSGAKWNGKGAFYYPDGSCMTGLFKDGALKECLTRYRLSPGETMALHANGETPIRMDLTPESQECMKATANRLAAVSFKGEWIASKTSRKEVGFDAEALNQAKKDAKFFWLGKVNGEFEKPTLQACFPSWENNDLWVLSRAIGRLDDDAELVEDFVSGNRSASENRDWVQDIEESITNSIAGIGTNSKEITTDKDEEIIEFAKLYAEIIQD